MNKRLKETARVVMIFFAVFIVPSFLLHYFNSEDNKIFYDRVNQDNEICQQRAERDSVENRWCNEIRDASKQTYNLAKSTSNFSILMLVFQSVLFVVLVKLEQLKKQIVELKEKIDV